MGPKAHQIGQIGVSADKLHNRQRAVSLGQPGAHIGIHHIQVKGRFRTNGHGFGFGPAWGDVFHRYSFSLGYDLRDRSVPCIGNASRAGLQ